MSQSKIIRNIFLLILTILIIGFVPIFRNLYNIHTLDPDEVIKEINHTDQLSHQSPISDMPIIKEKDDKNYLYFFGGSSIVNSAEDDSGHQVSNEKIFTFPNLINDQINKYPTNNFTVLNYGKVRIDSSLILRGIKEIIASKPPQVIAYYLDHDDYTEIYKNFVTPKLSLYRGSLLKIFLSFNKNLENDTFSWLMSKGLLHLDPETFDKIDTHIEQRYLKSILELAKLSQSFKIKLVLIMPVHNLYSKKMDPDLEIKTLTATKQLTGNELLNKLIRLKEIDWAASFRPFLSTTQIQLKSIAKQDNIYLLNLKEILIESGHSLNDDFIFNHSTFYQKSHAALADILLKNNVFSSCLK